MGERAASGDVGAAFGDGGLVLVSPRLVVLRRVGEGLKHGIMALRLNEAQRRGQLGFGQLIHQAMQLLPGCHVQHDTAGTTDDVPCDEVPNRQI